MPRLGFISVIFACLVIDASAIRADVIQWAEGDGGNGHWYELILDPMDWDAAKLDAETRIHRGEQGHLATLISQEENDFVAINLLASIQIQDIWLGGFQAVGSPEPGGGWQWVTGEAWTFENWFTSEPNNTGVGEDVLQIFSDSTPTLLGHWNDLPRSRVNAFLVEYVPEPSTALLIVLTAPGFRCRRRTRPTW